MGYILTTEICHSVKMKLVENKEKFEQFLNLPTTTNLIGRTEPIWLKFKVSVPFSKVCTTENAYLLQLFETF